MRIGEVNLDPGIHTELEVLGHFFALIPRQRMSKMGRQAGHLSGDSLTDGRGVVDTWQMRQQREPGGAFHQSADR